MDQAVFPEWTAFLGDTTIETKPVLRSVVKRSGDIEIFNRNKIKIAIQKAIEAVTGSADEEKADSLTAAVEEKLTELMASRHAHSIPAIEEIQDIIENVLIERNEAKIAKAFILYRAKREAVRDAERLMIDIDKTMNGYLSKSDWRVNENANVNFSLGGLILHNSGTITANYWLKNIYTPAIAEAHQTAAFHIHDLSMFSGYCAGWSLRQLIQEGLGGVPDKITSKPARHLSTLIQQIVNFLGIMQNGSPAVMHTSGNEYAHLVLRGSVHGANCDRASIEESRRLLAEQGIRPVILIDCSHGNSQRQPEKQRDILLGSLRLRLETPQIEAVRGCMLESFIQAGAVSPEHCTEKSEYGKSITDPCMSWEMTESLLTEAADIWR